MGRSFLKIGATAVAFTAAALLAAPRRHADDGWVAVANSPNHEHEAFLAQLSAEERAYWIEWFKTLPLWLDLGGVRVVHACWHPASMEAVEAATGSNRLTTVEHFVAATDKGSDLYKAIEVLLKGPEINLSKHQMVEFFDHEAKKHRTDARIRWWDHTASTLPALAALGNARLESGDPYPTYEPREVRPEYLEYVYTDQVPLFYGHYCRKWEYLLDEWSTYTACVDFHTVSGRTVVAYRWNGEPEIHWENYVPHDETVVVPTPSD